MMGTYEITAVSSESMTISSEPIPMNTYEVFLHDGLTVIVQDAHAEIEYTDDLPILVFTDIDGTLLAAFNSWVFTKAIDNPAPAE